MIIEKIKKQLAGAEGYTLIELMIVLLILGVLAMIAVPSYLGFRVKAQGAAAQSNVRASVPAAESYFQDPAGGNNSYNLISGATVRTQAPGIPSTVKAGYNAAKDGYCLQDTQGTNNYFYTGGNGGSATVASGTCNTTTYTMA